MIQCLWIISVNNNYYATQVTRNILWRQLRYDNHIPHSWRTVIFCWNLQMNAWTGFPPPSPHLLQVLLPWLLREAAGKSGTVQTSELALTTPHTTTVEVPIIIPVWTQLHALCTLNHGRWYTSCKKSVIIIIVALDFQLYLRRHNDTACSVVWGTLQWLYSYF